MDRSQQVVDLHKFISLFFVMMVIKYVNYIKIFFKYCYYRRNLKSCGSNVSIYSDVRIFYPDRISIGKNVSIHPMCYIDGEGGIDIGNNVSIAHNVSILSFNHTWNDATTPIKYNPKKFKPISISDDVWIGCGARIMPGVRIQNRCIIAAGSVVTKDCQSNGIYAGVPAKLIKTI